MSFEIPGAFVFIWSSWSFFLRDIGLEDSTASGLLAFIDFKLPKMKYGSMAPKKSEKETSPS